MSLKYHTIIVVPHTRARFRKLRFTNRQLLGASAAALLVTLGSLFVTWSFFTTSVDRSELDRIRVENESIREVNQAFETSLRELRKRLSDYEERTRELAIVAGLDTLSTGGEAGIGGAAEASFEADSMLETLERRSGALADELDRVSQGLGQRQRLISTTPAIAPARGVLTSGFGPRRDPITGSRAAHPGIDIASYPGSPVVAPADGIVVRSGRNGGLGNAVFLSHGFGLSTRYGHLSKVNVEPGRQVRRGDVIGFVGSTGRTTGYHLHYEVRLDGRPVNPLQYILDPPEQQF